MFVSTVIPDPQTQAADPYDGKSPGAYWHAQIEHAKEVFNTWMDRGSKVVKRYRDERSPIDRRSAKFNILWSNVQVMQPALYGRQAKPEVSRRYMDRDPVGRLASMILERVIGYETEQFSDFNHAMNEAVLDRLLPGRGTAWIRFEPIFGTEEPAQITGNTENGEEGTPARIDAAHAPIDYVYWRDFLHSPARTWAEVWWVARAVYLGREEGIERFGDIFKLVPLTNYREDNSNKSKDRSAQDPMTQKAKVYEIWNKRTHGVCWVAEGFPQALDEREDPLQLEEFFPCPEPLYATMTAGSLIPIPDYCEYEDQARELDTLTGRISQIVKAVKVVGVFNGQYKELVRLLNEGQDNKVFPVDNWGALAEKGGLHGAFELLDVSQIAVTLQQLYQSREAVKQTIYEISGISDILRGATNANETLGAQQLKASFGNLRLRDKQASVARFASDIFKLKAQIICRFYPPELLVKMSSIQDTTDGQNPQLIMAAIQMLQNATVRDFHISVESDSLGQIDELEEKQAAAEVIGAIGGFLKEALPVVEKAPEMLPMISEMLLFIVRRFRAGRTLEGAIEQSMQMLKQRAMQQQGQPQMPPEVQKAQAQIQTHQARTQGDIQKSMVQGQIDQSLEQQKLKGQAALTLLKGNVAMQQQRMNPRLPQ